MRIFRFSYDTRRSGSSKLGTGLYLNDPVLIPEIIGLLQLSERIDTRAVPVTG